jgi:hypothetical protein
MRFRGSVLSRNLTVMFAVLAFSLLAASGGGAGREAARRSARALAPQESSAGAFLIKRVTIAETRYRVLNTVRAIRLVRSPYAKLFSYLVGACKAAGSFGFSDGGTSFGVVAYVPTNPADCFPVSGGGGGGGGGGPGPGGPCAQFYRTIDGQFWVMIAGTDTFICANMSTQVPGSISATTTDASDGGVFDANSAVWVTCQEYDAQQNVLWDYIEPRSSTSNLSYPRSTAADWIDDSTVDTGYTDWIPHIPRCSGVNTAF